MSSQILRVSMGITFSVLTLFLMLGAYVNIGFGWTVPIVVFIAILGAVFIYGGWRESKNVDIAVGMGLIIASVTWVIIVFYLPRVVRWVERFV